MRILNGLDLAGFIKERQAKDVRNLRQAFGVVPRLAIIRTNPDPVVDSYMKLKQTYGKDILVEVDVHTVDQSKAIDLIKKLNKDESVQGIIVQIPLPDISQTDEVLASVDISKDVDGLAPGSLFDPATPVAINWLLAGYNIEPKGKEVLIVGQGRLVGRPLMDIFDKSGIASKTADKKTANLSQLVKNADIVISATGIPGLIKPEMIKPKAVIVDAGVATDSNGLIGDVAPEVREIEDITITPEKGGVGPLTVCALFDNVIKSCRMKISQEN